jgi:hypothetical protein
LHSQQQACLRVHFIERKTYIPVLK